MIRLKLLGLYITIVSTTCFGQQLGSFKDPRDGRVYKTVKIGSQVWMAENLNASTFRNGDSIPEAKTDKEWLNASANKQPAWCYYDNDSVNGKFNGKLYNWYAVNDSRGLAPSGWHVSTDVEWVVLWQFAGEAKFFRTGAKLEKRGKLNLMSKSGWIKDPRGKNNDIQIDPYNFSAFPAGNRSEKGIFAYLGARTYFWKSDPFQLKGLLGHYRYFSIGEQNVLVSTNNGFGFSVRCLMD